MVPPPTAASIAAMRPEEVIAAFGKVYREQTAQLQQCNVNLSDIQDYVIKMNTEIKALNDGSKTKPRGDDRR